MMSSNSKLMVLLVGLTVSFSSFSAQWSVKPIFNPSIEYDDNISLSTSNKEDSFKFVVRPTIVGAYETETAFLSLTTGYNIERYTANTRDTEDNPFFQVNSSKSFERSSLGIDYSFSEASSRDTAALDTGNFSSRSVITTHTLSPSYSYSLSEIDSVSVNFSYIQREYSTEEFRDNETKSIATSWQRQFSERFIGYTSFSYSNYQSGESVNSTENDNYNLSVGVSYDLSEKWSLNGNVGVRYLDSKTGIDSQSTSGSSFDLNANYQSELGRLSISALRRISPSSSGDVNEQDIYNVDWSSDLTERLSAGISSRYIETTSATENSNIKRENFNISPNLSWKLSPKATIELSYRYRQQKRTEQETAKGNSVSLTFSYDFQGYRLSR
jgi:predicted porin